MTGQTENKPVNSQAIKGFCLALLGYMTYSGCDGYRKTLTLDYTSAEIFFIASALNFFILLAFASKMGGFKSIAKSSNKKVLTIRGISGALASLLSLITFSKMPMVEAYTLFFISPFIVAFLSSIIWKEKISAFRILAMIAGFAGIIIAMRPGMEILNEGTIYGILAAISFSVFLLTAKPLRGNETNFSMLMPPVLASIVISVFLVDDMSIFLDVFSNINLLLFAALPSLIGTYFLIKAYTMADGSLLAPTHYTQLIWGFIIGMVAFSEIPDIYVLSGSLIVALSGVVLVSENSIKKLFFRRKAIETKYVAAE